MIGHSFELRNDVLKESGSLIFNFQYYEGTCANNKKILKEVNVLDNS